MVNSATLTPPSTPTKTSLPPPFLTQSSSSIDDKFLQLREHEETIRNHPDSLIVDPIAFQRDRHIRIYPYNHNRIELREVREFEHPYFNASPINLGRKNETFIATQGPLKEEIGRFWRMVWQEGCEVIVMLTKPYEKGREMCAMYYPEKVGEVVAEDMESTVECLAFMKELGTEVRKIKLVRSGEERIVWHFFYAYWPDMTATQREDQTAILSLIKMSRFRIDKGRAGQEQGIGAPRLVHCSGGIVRTGTFIALDHLLQDIGLWKKGKMEMNDPVFDTVKRLREQRMRMVYMKEQYASIYQMLRDLWDTWEGYPGNIYKSPSPS